MDDFHRPAGWNGRDGPSSERWLVVVIAAAALMVWPAWATPAFGLEASCGDTELLPAAESGAGAATESLVPGVKVSTEATGAQGELLRTWVEEQVQSTLERRGEGLGPEDAIRISVNGDIYDYRIDIELVHRGRLLDDQPKALACECGTDSMLEQLGTAIDAAVERLEAERVAEAEAEAVRAAEAEREQGTRGAEPEMLETGRGVRLTTLGRAAIGVGAVGAGVLGVGIGLVVRPDEWQTSGRIPVRYTTHPPGIAMVAGGGAALAAGAVMLVVDLVRRRDRSTSFSPMGSLRHVGLSITGRF